MWDLAASSAGLRQAAALVQTSACSEVINSMAHRNAENGGHGEQDSHVDSGVRQPMRVGGRGTAASIGQPAQNADADEAVAKGVLALLSQNRVHFLRDRHVNIAPPRFID